MSKHRKAGKAGRTASAGRQVETAVTPEERLQMIAEAAYYHAEHRGFQAGEEERDWFEAELEIDRLLSAGKPTAAQKRTH